MNGQDYAFELFEDGNAVRARSAAAPQRHAEEQGASQLKQVSPKSMDDKRREEHITNRKIALMIAFVAVVFSVIFCQISAGAERYELIRQIAAVEEQIETAKSENVRLNAALEAKMSINRIDTYAEEVLHMKKIESYQVECVDRTQGDQVLYYTSHGWKK